MEGLTMLRSTADLINRVGTSHAICIAERTAIALTGGFND
jgi:hypothetical protein